ncbi:MAG: HNH endonuclease [Lachnospiraceae bacterium]|nr:HNH endonuclease [Lachnospiraceae bacterium]
MGFFDGLARGLSGGSHQGNSHRKNYRDSEREILDLSHDEDDEILSNDYRDIVFENSSSNNGWFKCSKCGKNFRRSDMDADHIVPKSKGGSNSRYNLQLICKHCNRSKRDDTSETAKDLEKRYREIKRQDKEDLEFLKSLKNRR